MSRAGKNKRETCHRSGHRHVPKQNSQLGGEGAKEHHPGVLEVIFSCSVDTALCCAAAYPVPRELTELYDWQTH